MYVVRATMDETENQKFNERYEETTIFCIEKGLCALYLPCLMYHYLHVETRLESPLRDLGASPRGSGM